MAISEGSTTYVAYKKESTPNTAESGSGGQILRRVTALVDLVKAEVTSAEKRTDFQEQNVTHGTRSVNWSVNGEMFGGDYEEFIAAALRQDFAGVTTVSASSGDTFTISSGVLTRGAGGGESFIDDGVVAGMIVRLTLLGASNNSRNLLVTAVTATTLTLAAADGGAAVADNSDASESATIVIPGQYTYVPAASHTSDTFTIEKYDSKTDTSQVAHGCKVGTLDISIQPDQAPTISFSGLGIDRAEYTDASAPVLTSPTAAGTGALMAAAIGLIRLNGSSVAVVTGANLSIDLGISNQPVIASNISPDVFYGRAIEVTGSLNVLREGVSIENIFDDETEVELHLFTEVPGSAPRAFYSFFMPRVKLTSATPDDPDGPVVITANFRALKKATATGYNATTLQIQDSSIS